MIPTIEASPRAYARAGGWFYLAIIVIGLWGEAFVRGTLVVSGDAVRTAANLLAHESLWRTHIAAEMVLLICAAALLTIELFLLWPVSRELTLFAGILCTVSIALEAAATMYLLQPLFTLGSTTYLRVFTPEQLAALARVTLRSHGYGFGLSLIFFGCFCLVIGYLIYRSGFLPKLIGVMMAIAGVGYLMNSFALIVSPPLADRLFPVILLPGFFGELSLCLWLIVKGVKVPAWQKCLAASRGTA